MCLCVQLCVYGRMNTWLNVQRQLDTHTHTVSPVINPFRARVNKKLHKVPQVASTTAQRRWDHLLAFACGGYQTHIN
jgi:hypothetical protein